MTLAETEVTSDIRHDTVHKAGSDTLDVPHLDTVKGQADLIEWLDMAYQAIRLSILQGAPIIIRILAGFCLSRTKPGHNGQYHAGEFHRGCLEKSETGSDLIVINLMKVTGKVEVLKVLLHEMIHACYPDIKGHKGKFRETARRLGIEGALTLASYGMTDNLSDSLESIARDLPALPLGNFNFAIPEKIVRKVREKYECPVCSNAFYAVPATFKGAICLGCYLTDESINIMESATGCKGTEPETADSPAEETAEVTA